MRKSAILCLIALAVLILPPVSRAQANAPPILRKIAVGFDLSIGMGVKHRVMDNISRSGVLPHAEQPYDQQEIDKAKAEILQICALRGLHANVFVQTNLNSSNHSMTVSFRIVPQ